MCLKNRIINISLCTLIFAPVLVQADSWKCEYDSLIREVIIQRTTSSPVPCQVVYKKPTEGIDDQVVWSAEFEASYCEEKAADFVAKLQSYGWSCIESTGGDENVPGDEGEGTIDSETGEDSDTGENATGS